MNILRMIVRQLASNSFRLSALMLAVVTTAVAVFGTATAVKTALDKSGIYAKLPAIMLQQAKASQGNNSDTAATLEQPEVAAAAKAAFNETYLRASFGQVIDGTYSWLDGSSKQPDFKIDLQPAITAFEKQAGDAGEKRLKTLPHCSTQQLRELNTASTKADIFALPCLPPGVSIASLRQQYVDNFISKNDFLKNPVLTADNLPKDSSGQTIFERARYVPQAYQWLRLGPLVLGGLTVLLALAVLFLFPTRRRGLRSLAASLIGNGVLLLIIGLLVGLLFNRLVDSSSLHLSDTATQKALVDVARVFNGEIGKYLMWFGGAYLAIGVIKLIIQRATRPKANHKDAVTDQRADDSKTTYESRHHTPMSPAGLQPSDSSAAVTDLEADRPPTTTAPELSAAKKKQNNIEL